MVMDFNRDLELWETDTPSLVPLVPNRMTGLRRAFVQKASLSTPCSLHRQSTSTPVVCLPAFSGLGEDSDSISHHPKVLPSLH